MNYYNPYYLMSPVNMAESPRLFSGIFGRGGFTLGTILNGAQRTLGLVNQAIPIIKEAAPMMRNAKTMFKVMNEFKKMDAPSKGSDSSIVLENNSASGEKNNYQISSGPTFFV